MLLREGARHRGPPPLSNIQGRTMYDGRQFEARERRESGPMYNAYGPGPDYGGPIYREFRDAALDYAEAGQAGQWMGDSRYPPMHLNRTYFKPDKFEVLVIYDPFC